MTNWEVVKYLMPEAILAAVATLIAVASTFTYFWQVARAVAVIGLLLVGGLVLGQAPDVLLGEGGPVVADALAWYGRVLAVLLGILFVVGLSQPNPSRVLGEAIAAALFAFLGLMIASAADDLVLLFVGLELVSIASYVLLGLAGARPGGLEAAIKYFLLSVLSSAIMLYGFSFLYGLSGSTAIGGIAGQLASAAPDAALMTGLGVVLVVAGLGFKMTAVPFHFYAPDVYQATTLSNAGLLAVLPKAAAVVALVRLVLVTAVPGAEWTWQLMLVLALITMTLGNVCALWQRDVRRMMAYSSIAHAGYLLIGLTVAVAGRAHVYLNQSASGEALPDGTWALLFYILVYGLATLGVFSGLTYFEQRRGKAELIDDLSGAGLTSPTVSVAMAVCLFSLAGLPPLAGFLGKFFLFRSAIGLAMEQVAGDPLRTWTWVLVVVGIANAAVAAAYYLRVIAAMYFGADHCELTPGPRAAATATILAGLLVVLVGLAPGEAASVTQRAADAVAQRLRQTDQQAETIAAVAGRTP